MSTRKYGITEHLASSNRQISPAMGVTQLIILFLASMLHKYDLLPNGLGSWPAVSCPWATPMAVF